jgi:hypothetical protein
MAMSQISPPLRIALVAAIAFLAVWMVALRPSDEAAEPAAPVPNVQSGAPAESAPGEVAQQAQTAANATEASSAPVAGEAPEAAATAGSTAAAAGSTQATPVSGGDPEAAKDSGLPTPILRAIADEKVLVLLFWNPRGGDDRAQRTAIRNLPRHGGKVYTHVANVKDVSRYASITRGVNLSQSPTTVVVDPKLGATPLVGFSARYEVDQIVSDALRVKR